ncbi:lipocalin family protein [Phenylobacterium sp.]|uniref:lipocalin family protein n=1 Tax=Phenylobacterium sp. TaxID=1871053 RepID=UPI00260028BF|nr:lipocalin family protein [Phenylobacterium sp.]
MTSLAIGAALLLAAATPGPPAVGPIAPDVVYSGAWHEQARTPAGLTKGCEWAVTAYGRDDKGRITVHESCHPGRQDAAERAIEGSGEVRDPGLNATVLFRYRLGPLRPTREMRIIAIDPDGAWYISAEPGIEHVYVFTRETAPPVETVRGLAKRLRDLGYRGALEILATPGRDRASETP